MYLYSVVHHGMGKLNRILVASLIKVLSWSGDRWLIGTLYGVLRIHTVFPPLSHLPSARIHQNCKEKAT